MTERAAGPVVVKVGGSLYDLPELGPRLCRWLDNLGAATVLLVPGGGAMADAVRDLDCRHRLGEERAHWLALRALSVNALLLEALVPGAALVPTPRDLPARAVLDPYTFLTADEGRPGCLAHAWHVTSDAVAARAAVVGGAACLYLLKSLAIPEEMSWEEAGRRGLVDTAFAAVLRQAPALRVTATNFRKDSKDC
jgi:aspartokinase-like uncharacterized kinase